MYPFVILHFPSFQCLSLLKLWIYSHSFLAFILPHERKKSYFPALLQNVYLQYTCHYFFPPKQSAWKGIIWILTVLQWCWALMFILPSLFLAVPLPFPFVVPFVTPIAVVLLQPHNGDSVQLICHQFILLVLFPPLSFPTSKFPNFSHKLFLVPAYLAFHFIVLIPLLLNPSSERHSVSSYVVFWALSVLTMPLKFVSQNSFELLI